MVTLHGRQSIDKQHELTPYLYPPPFPIRGVFEPRRIGAKIVGIGNYRAISRGCKREHKPGDLCASSTRVRQIHQVVEQFVLVINYPTNSFISRARLVNIEHSG